MLATVLRAQDQVVGTDDEAHLIVDEQQVEKGLVRAVGDQALGVGEALLRSRTRVCRRLGRVQRRLRGASAIQKQRPGLAAVAGAENDPVVADGPA